jgi:hypothetical protein
MSKHAKNKNKKTVDDDIDLDKLLEEEIAKNVALTAAPVSNLAASKTETANDNIVRVTFTVILVVNLFHME